MSDCATTCEFYRECVTRAETLEKIIPGVKEVALASLDGVAVEQLLSSITIGKVRSGEYDAGDSLSAALDVVVQHGSGEISTPMASTLLDCADQALKLEEHILKTLNTECPGQTTRRRLRNWGRYTIECSHPLSKKANNLREDFATQILLVNYAAAKTDTVLVENSGLAGS